MRRAAVVAIALAAVFNGAAQAPPSKHRITVQFDYDFRGSRACSVKVQKDCVREFNLYDISAGISKRKKLMSIPLPPRTRGVVRGISATTPPLVFEPGKHLLAVVALRPDGTESDFRRCEIWVSIPE